MPQVREPVVSDGDGADEASLQKAVTDEIKSILVTAKQELRVQEFVVQSNFGLDLAVLISNSDGSVWPRFVELKVFVGHRPGGVGFGDSRGRGPQVDILLLEEGQTTVLDQCVRWVLLDGTKPTGSPRYSIFSCSEARAAAMNGVARGKQNNLRVRDLTRNSLTWGELRGTLEKFLLN